MESFPTGLLYVWAEKLSVVASLCARLTNDETRIRSARDELAASPRQSFKWQTVKRLRLKPIQSTYWSYNWMASPIQNELLTSAAKYPTVIVIHVEKKNFQWLYLRIYAAGYSLVFKAFSEQSTDKSPR